MERAQSQSSRTAGQGCNPCLLLFVTFFFQIKKKLIKFSSDRGRRPLPIRWAMDQVLRTVDHKKIQRKNPFRKRKGSYFSKKTKSNQLSSFDLAGAETTRANRYGLVCSVNNGANLSDVCLPGSACFTVGVRNIVSESNTFTAAHTFCHILHLPRKFRTILT